VGITKKKFIRMEIGPEEMRLMREIKNVFDPKGMLNPGKIFP
jgi:glycolate oxidase